MVRTGGIYLALVAYVLSLVLFASSMCNPTRPYIELLSLLLLLSTAGFGILLHRRLYGRRR